MYVFICGGHHDSHRIAGLVMVSTAESIVLYLSLGMTSDFFKLLTLLFFQVQCEELKETIQENFTWIKSVQ